MKKFNSFFTGVVTTILLLALTTTALAASENVTFNFANVALNGETKITAGKSITAPNGQQIPGSILYTDAVGGKTNYLPIRAISDLLGVEIDYDSATKTVLLKTPGEKTVGVIPKECQNALRGDKDLILARGGTLLPDDAPESYCKIDGVFYKMFVTKGSTSDAKYHSIEYAVGNQDILDKYQRQYLDTLVNGEYPKNSKGESYGGTMLAEYVGYNPDLVAAVGTKGEDGYIRKSDIKSIPDLPADQCPHEFTIPLYDSEGKIIGEFPVGCGGHFNGGMSIDEAKEALKNDTMN